MEGSPVAYLTWLPDVLRSAGLDVHVMPGAATRSAWSAGGMGKVPPAVIWHHTATSKAWKDGHVAALLRDGRRDLSGPLSQTGVERDGTWVVVALGRANHDGYGRYGNKSIGVEVYNDGRGEPYPAVQLDATQRGIAAILAHLQHPASRCLGHKESASHKIDPLLDMRKMRARIARHLTAPPQEDDEMVPLIIRIYDDHGHNWQKDPDGVAFWERHGRKNGVSALITDMLGAIYAAAKG